MHQSANQAVGLFHQAERLGHDPAACAAQRWYCHMLLGEFERAWRESDAIAQLKRGGERLWDGKPFDGNRVVVRCLHGFGDAIQFLRYGPALRARATRVIFEAPLELVALLRCKPFIDEVISWSDGSSHGFGAWDQQIEVMELPYANRTTLHTIPASVPYLAIKQVSTVFNSPRPKVGLVWSASNWNPSRSILLSDLDPILSIPGVTFYSFQHGEPREQLRARQDGNLIHDTSSFCRDILDTATALVQMDLLITVDTMAAHLAGALGIPVWVLLTREADWRWMTNRTDSPWYPTMRLFRQVSSGDWRSTVTAVAEEIRRLARD
jgi:HAMP domain-containing protein